MVQDLAIDEAVIRALSDRLQLEIPADEVALYRDLVDGTLGLYRGLENLSIPPTESPARSFDWPKAEENPYNGWYVRSELQTRRAGLLAGRSVAIKDNIMVAGLPMANGTAVLDGLVGDIDATVVDRVLEAGGRITGKANCEAYCLSCSSFTNFTGPVFNPHNTNHAAGGSSSGSAALVAAGAVDMALGTDQGGSVRMPSSYCGTYGLKPTFGLVPYTGAMGMELSVDHIGPITRTVEDNARLLQVIAGDDGRDPRQRGHSAQNYLESLSSNIRGLRIGLVREGFGQHGADPVVDSQVRATAQRLGSLGATVIEVSVPSHLSAPLLWFPIVTASATYNLLSGGGYGLDGNDTLSVALVTKQMKWRERVANLPVTVRVFLMAGTLVAERLGAMPLARATVLRQSLRADYDRAMTDCDVVLLPTTRYQAPLLPSAQPNPYEQFGYATGAAANTLPFNLTGHPALSFPCAMRNGLPIGAMVVGRMLDEATLYRVATAYEQAFDWKAL